MGAVLALLVATAALTSGASAAPTVHTCANKVETLEIASGEPGAAPTKYKMTIKAISAQGTTCTAAYKFIGLVLKNKTTTTPEHFKCAIGHFKAPLGYIPQVCSKSSTKIKFAQQGG